MDADPAVYEVQGKIIRSRVSYVVYKKGDADVRLDGDFTLDDLRRLIALMEQLNATTEKGGE